MSTRRFLKWAGAKEKLIPQYQSYLPQTFGRYWEPFVGSGALFFNLLPDRATLSDANEELINCWQILRDEPDQLIALLKDHEQRHCESYYYEVRSRHPSVVEQLSLFAASRYSAVERAARLKYLNSTCFNGLYRTNAQNRFNTSFGDYKHPGICNVEILRAASAALQGVTIVAQDFDQIAAEPGDFVFFDPPYVPLNQTSFTSYTGDGFGWRDQIRLRDCARDLSDRGVYVLLANSDCPWVRDLYRGFALHEIMAARSINSKSEGRGKVAELLIQTIPA